MGQTSIDRLKDYLGQLPPQSQALLMREFERAIERGQDTAVATLVLEQLRSLARGPAEQAPPPRSEDIARLLFQPIEPFLVDGSAQIRPGQIRRSSITPIWQWLVREGAPDQVHEFEKQSTARDGQSAEAALRKLQFAIAEAIQKSTVAAGLAAAARCAERHRGSAGYRFRAAGARRAGRDGGPLADVDAQFRG